jgi:hypothetical protein
MRAYEPLYELMCARYGREQVEPRLADVLRRLIPRSSSLTLAERDRLLGVLNESDGDSAQSLYDEWDDAYLQLSDEDDGAAADQLAIYRGFEISRLASAVAEFKNKNCREFENFSSVMYELAAGLDWEDDTLISTVQGELALN